ncbi:MAG: hypothetical protein SAJ37_22650 [Oscillatoria sp. PMC 1068.18]|nr:hypothetical protein [Oscillatoria sp. PMC 1076.18]MEC4991545.1 hypothetical protein [Oscillatoria sp. PMC 1068.18]
MFESTELGTIPSASLNSLESPSLINSPFSSEIITNESRGDTNNFLELNNLESFVSNFANITNDLTKQQELNNTTNAIPDILTGAPVQLQTSESGFGSKLGENYQLSVGTLIANEEFSGRTGGIFGAPEPLPNAEDEAAFGNPNSRYLWVYNSAEEFESDIYTQILQDDSSSVGQIPPSFQLDGDDAIVLFGTTPEEIAYYSFTLYQTLTYAPEASLNEDLSGYRKLGASIGLSVNNANLNTVNSGFDSPYALIVTSNTETEEAIKTALIESGIPEEIISSYLFPSHFANAGTSENPEALSLLIRNTYQSQEEKDAVDSYIDEIPTLPTVIDFNDYKILSYGKREDRKSTVTIEDQGDTLHLQGNGWKKIEFPYTITPNTVIEFDFKSNSLGDIHGIGFDKDNGVSLEQIFQLAGTEAKGITAFKTEEEALNEWERYRVPVGAFFTGEMKYITFTNDHDVKKPTAESFFSNLKVYEQVPDPKVKVVFVEGAGITGNITDEDIPKWEENLRQNSIEFDLKLDQRLEQLEDNVIDYYEEQGYRLKEILTEEMRHIDPEESRDSLSFAAYDAPDALYTKFTGGSEAGPFEFGSVITLENPDDILMVLGVDHSAVGDGSLATYFSYETKSYAYFNPQTREIEQPLPSSFAGFYTQGSAETYLPEFLADNLFAVKIISSNEFGGGEPYTVNVPISEDVPLKARRFSVVGRVYLDEVTGTAPNPENFIPTRILWLEKEEVENQVDVATIEVSKNESEVSNVPLATREQLAIPLWEETEAKAAEQSLNNVIYFDGTVNSTDYTVFGVEDLDSSPQEVWTSNVVESNISASFAKDPRGGFWLFPDQDTGLIRIDELTGREIERINVDRLIGDRATQIPGSAMTIAGTVEDPILLFSASSKFFGQAYLAAIALNSNSLLWKVPYDVGYFPYATTLGQFPIVSNGGESRMVFSSYNSGIFPVGN